MLRVEGFGVGIVAMRQSERLAAFLPDRQRPGVQRRLQPASVIPNSKAQHLSSACVHPSAPISCARTAVHAGRPEHRDHAVPHMLHDVAPKIVKHEDEHGWPASAGQRSNGVGKRRCCTIINVQHTGNGQTRWLGVLGSTSVCDRQQTTSASTPGPSAEGGQMK